MLDWAERNVTLPDHWFYYPENLIRTNSNSVFLSFSPCIARDRSCSRCFEIHKLQLIFCIALLQDVFMGKFISLCHLWSGPITPQRVVFLFFSFFFDENKWLDTFSSSRLLRTWQSKITQGFSKDFFLSKIFEKNPFGNIFVFIPQS